LGLKGRFTEATTDFDRTLEVDPNNAQAFLGRGLAMLATNQPDRAIAPSIWPSQTNPTMKPLSICNGRGPISPKTN